MESTNVVDGLSRSPAPERRYTDRAETSCSGLDNKSFVAQDTELSRFYCTHCGKILMDPYSLPCGHLVCKQSIKTCQEKGQMTIMCNMNECENNAEFLLVDCKVDEATEKAIKKLLVHCKNEDCMVKPKLKQFKTHLDKECDFSPVKCKKCLKEFKRKNLQEHESGCTSQLCKYHSLGCEHVLTDTETDEELAKHNGAHLALLHMTTADISEKVSPKTIKNLQGNITKESLHIAGYNQMVRNLEQPQEVEGEVKKAIVIEKTAEEVTDNTKNLKEILVNRIPALDERQLQRTGQSQHMEYMDLDRAKRGEEVVVPIPKLPFQHNIKAYVFKVSNFSIARAKAMQGSIKRLHGPKFHAAPFSYLLCPMIYPNGDGPGAGTHISVFIAICKSPYDALLRWPLMARITFIILPQKPNVERIRHTFRSDVTSLCYSRPKTEMNAASGIPCTMSLDLLKQPSNFLVDDTLFLQVEVDLL